MRPSIVAISSESGFLHLMQLLLASVGFGVRTSSDWQSAVTLVKRQQPGLVIVDLLPWETCCWSALEDIKAGASTRAIPVLVCPVAGRLLAGHERLLALDGVHLWPEGFQLESLLETVRLALASPAGPARCA